MSQRVRKKPRNTQGIFVYGLTDSHVREFYQNHKSEYHLAKHIKRNYDNIKSISIVGNTLFGIIYDPFSRNTYFVSIDFIAIPVRSSEDINVRKIFCTCLQRKLEISLCTHVCATLGAAVDRYRTQSIFYPYDPVSFKIFVDDKQNILKYEYKDITIYQHELPQSTPHPQNIFRKNLVAKQLCSSKHVLALILLYSGNADPEAPICDDCNSKYLWNCNILAFEHYCAVTGIHHSHSLFQQSSIFGDCEIVKMFGSMFNIAEDKGRRTWVDVENNHGISRKTMTTNFHKVATVAKLVMNHTVPVGSTNYRATEFDGADLGKRKHGLGRFCKRRWFGKLYERLKTIKGGHLQFTLSGGHESVANYGQFMTQKSDVFSWLYTDTSSFARSHFVRKRRRNETTTHSKGEFVNWKHKTYPPREKAHPQGTEVGWVPIKTQRRIRHGLGKDDQFWADYFDWIKSYTDNSTMDVIIVFLTHLGIIWNHYRSDD
eukprot:332012_1